MKAKSHLLFAAFALTAALAGCQQAPKNPVTVRPSVPVPVVTVDRAQRLPLPPPRPPRPYIITQPRPAVDLLIEKVEASYEAGKRDYQAGNLPKARQDFDQAVDLILTSGLEVHTDRRLRDLFDRIVDAVHSYELEVATETEGDEEPEAGEPAPIEEIAELELPAGDPRLAQKAQAEIIAVPHDLPLTVNDSVLSYLSFFETPRGRAIVETGLRRAGRYHEMIRRVFKQEGVPQDLIYLAQAESAFKPMAVSRAGARGIWQFMPFRGQEYGLDRTRWIDQRNDPEKATHAAAHHLRDLYQMFGDWYLVMAAYNSGPLNVARAIERTGYADFWELQKRNALPTQTKNYVPIILAMTLIAKDAAHWGIHVQPDKPPRVETVKPGHPIDLGLVADATDTDPDEIRTLNPELVRSVTPDDPHFELRVPEGTSGKLREAIAAIPPGKWTSWRLHRVEAGETVSSVARRYRLSPVSVAQANEMVVSDPLPAGSKIAIPVAPRPVGRLVRYRVRSGDTLEGIAARFDVTVEDLKRWNKISGSRAPRGASLRIYAGGESPRSARSVKSGAQRTNETRSKQGPQEPSGEVVHYRVKPGETLFSIAQAYKTTVASLRQANPFLGGRPLEAGDLLTIEARR
jgi:membrane-bound lytic murein transglycosylase D